MIRFLSIFVMLVQLVIIYFWIFDWTKLVTTIGLSFWGGAIILGVTFYYFGKGKMKRLILFTTLITIFFAAVAIFIELATSSMP
ncbi:hypothetical protein [Piscibacillus salipiscarius]|uniref:Uncharacterized protein n=1 Tax=Piscibacillus salipiscarius TaxID=299480 RepID=A0ABW5Q9Y3_9BACI